MNFRTLPGAWMKWSNTLWPIAVPFLSFLWIAATANQSRPYWERWTIVFCCCPLDINVFMWKDSKRGGGGGENNGFLQCISTLPPQIHRYVVKNKILTNERLLFWAKVFLMVLETMDNFRESEFFKINKIAVVICRDVDMFGQHRLLDGLGP